MAIEMEPRPKRLEILHQRFAASKKKNEIAKQTSSANDTANTYDTAKAYFTNNIADANYIGNAQETNDNYTASDYYTYYAMLVGHCATELPDIIHVIKGKEDIPLEESASVEIAVDRCSKKDRKGRKSRFLRVLRRLFCCGWSHSNKGKQ